MHSKAAGIVIAALILAGCAGTTPPPRFSDVSPADPAGPEPAPPPLATPLADEPEAQALSPSPKPPAAAVAAEPYACPMHPEQRQATSGACPKCGMALVRRSREGSRP